MEKIKVKINEAEYEIYDYLPVIKQHDIALEIFKRSVLKDAVLGIVVDDEMRDIIEDTLMFCVFMDIPIPETNAELYKIYDENKPTGLLDMILELKANIVETRKTIRHIVGYLCDDFERRYKYENSLEYKIKALLGNALDGQSLESLVGEMGGLKELFIGLMANQVKGTGSISYRKKNIK